MEAMEQRFQLNPKLWQKLPDGLLHKVVEKVLVGLPFSKVLRFCFLSNRSRAFLLSMHYLLYFKNSDECAIFNPRTSMWESMPLRLSQAQALTLQHMELVCCDEGVLYFSSAQGDKSLLYNLLHGRCRESLRPPNATQNLISSAEYNVSMSNAFQWDIVKCASPQSSTSMITVTIIALSDTGFFKLFVGKAYCGGTSSRGPFETLGLHDSRRSGWVHGPEVNTKFHFLAFPTFDHTACEVFLGFQPSSHESSENSFDMLFYNVPKQTCRWQHILSFPELINVGMEKRLFATVTDGGELEFLGFVVDGGVRLVTSGTPPSPAVLQGNASFRFVHLAGGDVMYYIWLFQHQLEGQAIGSLVTISVETQNLVTGIVRGHLKLDEMPVFRSDLGRDLETLSVAIIKKFPRSQAFFSI